MQALMASEGAQTSPRAVGNLRNLPPEHVDRDPTSETRIPRLHRRLAEQLGRVHIPQTSCKPLSEKHSSLLLEKVGDFWQLGLPLQMCRCLSPAPVFSVAP